MYRYIYIYIYKYMCGACAWMCIYIIIYIYVEMYVRPFRTARIGRDKLPCLSLGNNGCGETSWSNHPGDGNATSQFLSQVTVIELQPFQQANVGWLKCQHIVQDGPTKDDTRLPTLTPA